MKWYNQETKERFIKSLEKQSNVPIANALFNGINKIERTYNCDMCDFSQAMLGDAFNSLGWNSYTTFVAYRTVLRDYIDWCLKEKLTAKNIPDAMKFQFSDVENGSGYSSSLFHSEKAFIKTLRVITDDNPSYNMCVVCLCLAWLQFEKGQAVRVLKDGVDFDKKTVTLDGEWTAENVSDTILNCLRRSIYQDFYGSEAGHKNNGRLITFINSPYVLRMTNRSNQKENQQVSEHCIDNLVAKLQKAQKQISGFDKTALYVKSRKLHFTKVLFTGRACKLREWENIHGEATWKNKKVWVKEVNLWNEEKQDIKDATYAFFKKYQAWKKEDQDDLLWSESE